MVQHPLIARRSPFRRRGGYRPRPVVHGAAGIAAIGLLAFLVGARAEEIASPPDWQPPPAPAVRRTVLAWLADKLPEAPDRARAEALWPAGSDQRATPDRLLLRLAETAALVRPEVRRLMTQCAHADGQLTGRDVQFLADPNESPLVRNNMRLIYGRWLARRQRFDEAEAILGTLRPDDVVDPATLLFYQAVVAQRLVHPGTALQKLRRLLQREDDLPRRYRHLAHLMQNDLAGLKTGSLDHIARRMGDIERRLALGRTDKKLRQVEGDVVKALDKLIEQMETHAQQKTAQNSGSQSQPGQPARESRLLTGRGPGKVEKKKMGDAADWGNLPEKQRQEAMQQIGRRFPSYYRRAVEQYFKRLAREK